MCIRDRITRGQNGVFAYHNKKGAFSDPGYKIEVVDNIGSGMAFLAGFLVYYLNGKSMQQSLNFGNASGAINTCLLYTSDAADERSSVDLGGRRIIKKKTKRKRIN